MKASELRIGNLISWISSGNIEKVMKIDLKYVNEVSEKDLSPIPLTKEWILNFGFVYDKVFDIYSNKSGHELMFVKDGYVEFYLYEYGGPFKCVEYVHQLQNLYFALTGTELEIR